MRLITILTAWTLKGVTPVSVKLATQEMNIIWIAQVSFCFVAYTIKAFFELLLKDRVWSYIISADINECNTTMNDCDDNADCTDTEGSYDCSCKLGFTGNGRECEGDAIVLNYVI